MVGPRFLRLVSQALSLNSSPLPMPEPSQNKHTRGKMAFSSGSPWNSVLEDWVLSGSVNEAPEGAQQKAVRVLNE